MDLPEQREAPFQVGDACIAFAGAGFDRAQPVIRLRQFAIQALVVACARREAC
jgi:hypothetical protein